MNGKPATAAVRLARKDAVLLLIMAQRPVNALTHDMRAALAAGLTEALAEDISAVVICSDIAAFSAGADLSALGTAPHKPSLSDLCALIEDFPKPIIVALNGSTLGAGFELALAAHGRVAAPAASLALPAAALGLVPEAGTSQRLPRLVGAAAALSMMLEPGALTAAQALAIGLLDEVAEGDLRARACEMASAMAAAPGGPVKTSDRVEGLRDGRAYQAAVAAARAKYAATPVPAALRLIDCVAAAQLLPIAQGLGFEAAAYQDLVQSPEAQGLRHAFYAERRAAFPPEAVAQAGGAGISSLAVWGAAEPAGDLVMQALAAGLRVALHESSRATLVAAVQRIAERQERAVAEGRMTPEARDADWARLSAGVGAVGAVDLVLDNGAPDLRFAGEAAPVISIGALSLRGSAGKIGLTVAPAQGLAAEISAGRDVAASELARALALGRRLGWTVLFTGPGGPMDQRLRSTMSLTIAQLEREGLARPVIALALAAFGIGVPEQGPLPKPPPEALRVQQACLAALANQGARLLTEGVARRPSDIDAAAVLNGIFPRWQGGPMFQADRRGLMVLRADLRKRAETAPQLYAPDPLFDQLIADGRDFAALNRQD